MEARLTKLNNPVQENTEKESGEVNNNQDLHTLENELEVCKDELLAAEESITRLTTEKLILARKLSDLEKKKKADELLLTDDKLILARQLSELEEKTADENNVLEQRFDQERKAWKSQVDDLEKMIEGFRQQLAAAEATLLAKDAELVALQDNLWELEELRDMPEDHIHEKEAKLSESQGSLEQPTSLKVAPDRLEHHGQVDAKPIKAYGCSSHQGLVKASLSQTAFASQVRNPGMKRPRAGDVQQIVAECLAEEHLQQIVAECLAKEHAKYEAYYTEIEAYLPKATAQMMEATAQAYRQVCASPNPGKPIPQFEIPSLPKFFRPLKPSIDQATDSAQHRKDHVNQLDV